MTRLPAGARRRSGRIPSPKRRPQHLDGPIPDSILAGHDEAIFRVLPQTVIDNLRRPASENALVWNLLYPQARPTLSLRSLLSVRPLWGSALAEEPDECLTPYFWGYAISGERLGSLDDALDSVDGPGQQTEVDVFLVGTRTLVLVEAKHLAAPGRCGRYLRGRCPEVHVESRGEGPGCRYWEAGEADFSTALEFGSRPMPDSPPPACAVHYQLGRTLLLSRALAHRLGLRPHVWMIVPGRRWPRLERSWLDFADRLRDPADWRALRVLAWEDVRRLTSDPQG
jgi:hypothetical protein